MQDSNLRPPACKAAVPTLTHWKHWATIPSVSFHSERVGAFRSSFRSLLRVSPSTRRDAHVTRQARILADVAASLRHPPRREDGYGPAARHHLAHHRLVGLAAPYPPSLNRPHRGPAERRIECGAGAAAPAAVPATKPWPKRNAPVERQLQRGLKGPNNVSFNPTRLLRRLEASF